MNLHDFSPPFRWEMVRAYPVVSGVPDARTAPWADIDAGFLLIMENRWLRRTLQAYLDGLVAPRRNEMVPYPIMMTHTLADLETPEQKESTP